MANEGFEFEAYGAGGRSAFESAGGWGDSTATTPVASGLDVSGLMKMALAGKARGKLSDIYNQNWLRNKAMMDEAYVRSLPKGVTGPAGMVTWDEDEEEMLMELDEGTKALRESWFRAEERAGEELAAYDIDERTTKKIDMFRAANAQEERRQRQELAALNYAQGTQGGTIAYWKEKALEDSINQNYLDFTANVAHPMSLGERGLLSAEQLAFGNAAIDAPRTLMSQGELSRLIGSGAHTGVNAAGASLASMALADTQAGFWSGLMGGASKYGGGASTYGAPKAGTTPQAAGNTSRYSSSPMIDGGLLGLLSGLM